MTDKIILRDYQTDVFIRLRELILAGVKSVIIVVPCRMGKTPLATFICEMLQQHGCSVLFQVHRKILVEQTSKMFDKYGISHGIIPKNHEKNKVILCRQQHQ